MLNEETGTQYQVGMQIQIQHLLMLNKEGFGTGDLVIITFKYNTC